MKRKGVGFWKAEGISLGFIDLDQQPDGSWKTVLVNPKSRRHRQLLLEFATCTGILKSGKRCHYRRKKGTHCGIHGGGR